MSESRHQTPDILVVPANPDKNASDCIIADMHGNDDLFLGVLNEREYPADRVFIAGDLVDRGLGGVNIIRTIVENNNDEARGKIYCVRGNHEDMCLNAIDALMMLTTIKLYGASKPEFLMNLHVLKKMSKTDPALKIIFSDKVMRSFLDGLCLLGKSKFEKYFSEIEPHSKLSFEDKVEYLKAKTNMIDNLYSLYGDFAAIQGAVSLHRVNGGQWLIDLYMKELTDTTISATDTEEIDFADSSDIVLIKEYLESLPYIIHVQGEVPFNIVHAAMPLSDDDLQNRIADGGWMTDDEKEYAMWARDLKNAEIKIIKIPGRNKYSVLTMVGHTIDGGVREEDNTLNLDVAAYARNATLIVKMPSCLVTVIFDNNDPRGPDKTILHIAEQTQTHLDKQVRLMKRHHQHAGIFQEKKSGDKRQSKNDSSDGSELTPRR